MGGSESNTQEHHRTDPWLKVTGHTRSGLCCRHASNLREQLTRSASFGSRAFLDELKDYGRYSNGDNMLSAHFEHRAGSSGELTERRHEAGGSLNTTGVEIGEILSGL